ncbi:DUF445 domain-containing protein [Leptospira yasudae]|uniref:DUF445 domain-containing protein n=2 Tax=Leptospira yasudae TaxID=2202201 RepID=A0A6N4QQ38_9LEPT|nr:DUF445 domain-containing protein [Leptospira yasudae]TGL79545.1 DUF445 domain-containing protein [Leptospira yasudae]TGL90062.1 DUF445 domain-containing protein [Leptospira yasudae]
MPFTYAFVGWVTNWVALKMTFYPLKFFGIPPYLGWQGIIPRKAEKMAGRAVDVVTRYLIDVEEMFCKVDPALIQENLRPEIQKTILETMKEVADEFNPLLWSLIPELVKNSMMKEIERQAMETIPTVFQDLRKDSKRIFDIRGLVIRNMTGDNVHLTVEMFQRVGAKEFRFIEISGFYFGFVLGLIQMGIWLVYPALWTLPVQGIIVGYLTNWLALLLIFRPLEPVRLGPFSFQGLFIKRQREVSDEYSKMLATKILSSEKILEELFFGRASEEVFNLVVHAIERQMDTMASVIRPTLSLSFTSNKYNDTKERVIRKIMSNLKNFTTHIEDYVEKAIDLESTLSQKMKALPPVDFEDVLRTVFKEDELLLILVGAALGAIVGLGQAFFMAL